MSEPDLGRRSYGLRATGFLLASTLLVALSGHAQTLAPQVAGGFYPAEPAELGAAVDAFLAHAPAEPVPGRLVAALVPHAGYIYSGAVAARVYRQLRRGDWDTVIILAAGHRTSIPGAAILTKGSFTTPLGEVPVDTRLAEALLGSEPLIAELPQAFQGEHSIEVQLPFLQRRLGRFRLVPLLMNSEDPVVARKIGQALAAVLSRRKTLLLVSSDLSHYPDAATARAVDGASLGALLQAPEDPLYFWKTNRLLLERGGKKLVCTECGEAALLAGAFAMKGLGARPRLLVRTHSGETPEGDSRRVVGYGALVWTLGGGSRPAGDLDDGQRRDLLKLARSAVERFLADGAQPEAALWQDPAFNLPAAVFVTLRRKDPEATLRGCIGTLAPEQPLAEAVQTYAVAAAVHDTRFPPVRAEELPGLALEVSRLSAPRRVASSKEVKKGQGVTLKQGGRSGLFLPQVWEELPDKTRFLEELCAQKAGLARDCWKDPATEWEVFDAEVFAETGHP